MRIPVIERVSLKGAFVAAALLVALQQVEHTTLYFSLLCGLFVMLSAIAFNAAGGLVYPSGSYVFATAVLTALVGLVYKLFLNEPAQSGLLVPDRTMETYCGGMVVLALVTAVSRRLTTTTSLLPPIGLKEMRRAAIGSLVLGIGIQASAFFWEFGEGSLGSVLRQLNHFTQMAALLAVFYQVRRTEGRSSTNWIVWVSSLWSFAIGVIYFSKEGMLGPPVTWFAAAVAAGHDFSRRQVGMLVLFAVFFQAYMVPYSQYGRGFRAENGSLLENARASAALIGDLQGTRTIFLETQNDPSSSYGDRPHFYQHPHGFFDRLTMLAPDDALTAFTDQGNFEGIGPTIGAFLNVIPHFIWKDKPLYFVGNMYAREIGMISEENDTTGISFTPTADAYHQMGWIGIFGVLPVVVLLLFLVMDSMSGDIRRSPWGLLFVVFVAHSAPEGGVGGQVYVATYGALAVLFIAMLSKYVLPIVTGVVLNADRPRVARTIDFVPSLRPLDRSRRPSSRPTAP